MSLVTLRRCGNVIPVVLAALLANACSSLPHGIAIPGAAPYPLLPSAVFTSSLSVTQSVTISGGNNQQFLLQTETGPEGLDMVALTGFGQKLFELQYRQDRLSVTKTPFMPDSLVPESLFADLQLSWWPRELLHDLFANTPIVFTETGTQPQRRIFRQGDAAVIEILYSPTPGIQSNLVYRDLRRGYTMQIDVLSAVPR
jgi:hypothetical protein